jgi:hypothetical protein
VGESATLPVTSWWSTWVAEPPGERERETDVGGRGPSVKEEGH